MTKPETEPETKPAKLKLTVSETRVKEAGRDLPWPGILRATTRGGVGEVDPLLEGIEVKRIYNFAAPTRGEAAGGKTLDIPQEELLAVEAEDGTTIFIRSDALA